MDFQSRAGATESSRVEQLSSFVAWSNKYITGDEKGEAQIFLDHLFQGFGQRGIKEAGATLEARVHSRDKATSFADLVWKPIVLIEMKKRGSHLTNHYRQAFDYWAHLVPDRPRYVVLCNFDEFWVYDFETQMDSPVDQLKISELPNRYGPLSFLFPTHDEPIFKNKTEIVTRAAADKLSDCFKSITDRKVDRDLAQRFILQTLMALFAEDIGLLDKYFFSKVLEDCKSKTDSYDLLGNLFVAMNTPEKSGGGRFKNVNYFNGGLFSQPARLELDIDELEMLKSAAQFDWSKVRPEIFGELFENTLTLDERHAFGTHFTHPADIMKIIDPTIVKPWEDRIENAGTLLELKKLLARIETFTVLDPACGCGNFLYIAYRELKRLEARIYERMTKYKSIDSRQRPFGLLHTTNFFGMDINPFAVELAKVTMMLARKLCIDELHITETALPLDNLDRNFISCDALIDINGHKTLWPKVDAIIGNPPFLGAKKLKPERGVQYVNTLRTLYPEIPGMADYCVYWLRRTHDHLNRCDINDPFTGRAGLVGTQNIRNNKSRIGGLDYISETGTIIDAVDNQPWSGEANVHVSIVNWIKTKDKELLPKKKKLWIKIEKKPSPRKAPGSGSAEKDYELVFKDVDIINSSLSDKVNVGEAKSLTCNTTPQLVFQGITPGHKGFICTKSERDAFIKKNIHNGDVLFPYLTGDEILSGNSEQIRYVIDFGQRNIIESQKYKEAFQHIEKTVLPDIEKKAREEDPSESARKQHLNRWWLHWRNRADMILAISKLSRYLVCSRVTKRPIFVFAHSSIRPGDALQVFAFEDDYSFGILQSNIHWLWFSTKCSKLKSDYRYTPESVFDTFPWPQSPNNFTINSIIEASRTIRHLRNEYMNKNKGGLRALYRTLDLPGKNVLKEAHNSLDLAVLEAYGFSQKDDLLTQILELNKKLDQSIMDGMIVLPPGPPTSFHNQKHLISSDSVSCHK
jgi:type II restriction/modification system DNA methylase subunit YeeA